MNDRLKFRVWCCNNNEWEKDEILISNRGNFKIYKNGVYFGTMKDRPNFHILEQCTGLKDKNGKLIYEGDIVEYSDDYWVVIYNKPRMEWGLMGYDYAIYGRDIKKYDLDVISCEIIGNIHENPELLEQSNED